MEMTDRIDCLVEGLKEKEALLEKLVLLLDDERDHIVELDTAGLEQKRESKLQLIGQLEQCKTVCMKALDDVAGDLKITAAVSLSAFLACPAFPARDPAQVPAETVRAGRHSGS